MGWAKPSYNENRKSIKKAKEGTTRIRILPPLHSCQATGKWCVQHKQHFGFDTTKPDGGKDYNTFYCVEVFDFKTKTVKVACPECESIKDQKDLLDSTKNQLKAKGKSKEEIAKTTEPITNWLRKHNLDASFYYNVKTPEGEFYTLKVPYTVKKKLQTLVDEYRKPTVAGRRAIDAIDADQGLWFDIIRSGTGFNTEYDVRVATETIEKDGETYEKVKLAPLTDADAEAAEGTCYDLADVGIRKIDLDKVKRLVDSGGDEEVIATIFQTSDRRERSRSRDDEEEAPKPAPKPAAKEASPPAEETPEEPPVKEASPPAEVEDDEEEVLRKQLEALQAKKKAAALVDKVGNKPVPAPAPAEKPAPKAETSPKALTEMSDDELTERFSKKKKA